MKNFLTNWIMGLLAQSGLTLVGLVMQAEQQFLGSPGSVKREWVDKQIDTALSHLPGVGAFFKTTWGQEMVAGIVDGAVSFFNNLKVFRHTATSDSTVSTLPGTDITPNLFASSEPATQPDPNPESSGLQAEPATGVVG